MTNNLAKGTEMVARGWRGLVVCVGQGVGATTIHDFPYSYHNSSEPWYAGWGLYHEVAVATHAGYQGA